MRESRPGRRLRDAVLAALVAALERAPALFATAIAVAVWALAITVAVRTLLTD